jgi:hypothetical protein
MYTLNVKLITGSTTSFDFFTADEANDYFYERRMLENRQIVGVWISRDKTFNEWLKEKGVFND